MNDVRPRTIANLLTFSKVDEGTWPSLLERAELLDRVGVDRVVASDHVVFGEALDDYNRPELGGVAGGTQPTGPDGRWLEPLTVLTAVAARTSRIRIGTNILLAALRRPVVLAKAISTLDVLSGGRVDLGVGVGWQRAEYDAAGLSFPKRGRLLNETLELCSELWTKGVVDLPTGRIHQMPKPLQPGGVPIWVGGRSSNPRMVERLVRFGSGWIPWGEDATEPRDGVRRIREAMDTAGREADVLRVSGALPAEEDRFVELLDSGVTDFRIPNSNGSESEIAETIEQFHQWISKTGR